MRKTLPWGTFMAVDRAKEAIAKAFEGNAAKYKDIFKIIDERWQCQLHHPLHLRTLFKSESKDGLYACIEKLVPSTKVQDKIISRYHCTQELNNNLAFLLQKELELKDLPSGEDVLAYTRRQKDESYYN
ncbi:hypothetical protein H5410_007066 [Solanum commersonii]|uniref:Uncharacterized protein n=1 Tax=Solanum commersonii TaxID=4109 RepID=A0A9J6ABG8_SOLCO|nr:hypothetical protein H5410_007066 [Solanum commersonii]